MHESSSARSLVHTIDTIAAEQGALSVVAAKVRLGRASCMTAEGLREHFNHAAKGTRSEGALLKVVTPLEATGDGLEIDQDVVLESVELRVDLSAAT